MPLCMNNALQKKKSQPGGSTGGLEKQKVLSLLLLQVGGIITLVEEKGGPFLALLEKQYVCQPLNWIIKFKKGVMWILGHVNRMTACVMVRMCQSSFATHSGDFFFFCFILTCLGNCRNPDELSFLYLRINFLQFIFQKHPCAFLFGYKHSCVFLGIFQNNISFIKHCLLCLNTTMVQRGMGRLAKLGTPWIDTEIKSYVVLWHLTSDVHQNGLTTCSSCKICVSTSMCWEGEKKASS